MSLRIKFACVKCGRTLGFYTGEAFWIAFEGKPVFNPKIYCRDCWIKESTRVKEEK